MKIEIWSDFLCPFCYIGKRRLEAALQQFAHKDEVEVVYRSFELNPNAKRDIETDIHSLIAAKYGISREQAQAANNNIAMQAKEVGLTFRFDTMIPTNSFDAHRLVHFAAGHGKMQEMMERLFQAYFIDSKHIGDRETLMALAAEVGLDKENTAAMLASDEYTAEVRADEQRARELGISGVPFFVFNGKYAVSGAQPSEVFLEVLQKVYDENRLNETMHDGAVCTDEACDIPRN
ncbi:MAG: DsbA family oxidoreductase [Ectobacillus sp.]